MDGGRLPDRGFSNRHDSAGSWNRGQPRDRYTSSFHNGDSSRILSQPYCSRFDRNFQRIDRPGRATDEHRHWIYSKTVPPPYADRFVIVSYNILGVDNASQHWRELYAHIPSFIMDWGRRKGKILLEIGLWSPDVICLQEVDRFDELQHEFVQRGYEGIFKGRTGGASDGCAMFWRAQKFRLVEEESIEFQELDLRNNVAQLCVIQARHKKRERGKSNSTEEINTGNCVVVCNIHVLFNPNRGDIKLGQARHLLKNAHSLSKKWGGIPVIIAGDFNSLPQSPLYQYLHISMLDVLCFDRRSISGQTETSRLMRGTKVDRWTPSTQICAKWENQEIQAHVSLTSTDCATSVSKGPIEMLKETKAELNAGLGYASEQATLEAAGGLSNKDRLLRPYQWTPEELKAATGDSTENVARHRFKLRSAYSSIEGPGENRDAMGEPLVTSYHGRFMGTVDYIWFSEGLTPVRVLDLLPVHVLQKTKGLPSKKWGSDHLALACEFAFFTSEGTMEEDMDSSAEENAKDFERSNQGGG